MIKMMDMIQVWLLNPPGVTNSMINIAISDKITPGNIGSTDPMSQVIASRSATICRIVITPEYHKIWKDDLNLVHYYNQFYYFFL